ncbi:hypothetical protein L2E82_12566 [Cichorium intybus]|uniref:Uncharacterized protein n=1 Tax=Cichorium intybus TaxID=13427 RepID=A0ACB9GHP0_CICIN|nr:hypothetical protein L2E82_12566 [Cichorium intybus]
MRPGPGRGAPRRTITLKWYKNMSGMVKSVIRPCGKVTVAAVVLQTLLSTGKEKAYAKPSELNRSRIKVKGAKVAVGTGCTLRQADRGEGSHTSSRGSEPHVIRNDESEPNPPPQPVTMEAIQFLIDNLRNELRQEVNNIIDNRMGEPNAQSSQEASKKTTEEAVSGGNKREEKGCSFKSFMACKPPEYYGSFEPKVTMRWVREIEQVMQASKCGENDRVNYASRQLKDDALVWWNTKYESLGKDVVYGWSWAEFVLCLKDKFCPTRDLEKMNEDFLTIKKGDMTVDEYTKNFCDMLPFVGESYPSERSRINRYVRGLPWNYELEVKKAETLDGAINAARTVEDVGKRRKEEGPGFSDKRKTVSSISGNIKKKGKMSSSQSRQGSVKKCEKCGKEHGGEC